MTEPYLLSEFSYELTPLSKTVNAKTGTTIENFLTEYDKLPNVQGTQKKITLGENTSLKNLGVDVVEIHKAPGQIGTITFSKETHPKEGYWEGAEFKIGETKAIRKFINMLRELPKEELAFYGPSLSTVKAMLKLK